MHPEPARDWRQWWRYASEDLRVATMLLDQHLSPRWVCTLAQQASEKAVKAVLIHHARDFPRTHDLSRLARLLPNGSAVSVEPSALDRLSAWSVAGRYPADLPEAAHDDAETALTTARDVLFEAAQALPGTAASSLDQAGDV